MNLQQRVYWLTLFSYAFLLWILGSVVKQDVPTEILAFENGFPGLVEQWQSSDKVMNGWSVNYSLKIDGGAKQDYWVRRNCGGNTSWVAGQKILVGAKVLAAEHSQYAFNAISSLGIWFVDSRENIVSYRNVAFAPSRFDGKWVERVVVVPVDAVRCVLGVRVRENTVGFEVVGARLAIAKTNQMFLPVTFGLAVSGIALFLVGLFILYPGMPVIRLVVYISGVVFALGLSVLPGSSVDKYLSPILNWLAVQSGHLGPSGINWLFKLGHLFLFFLVGVLFFMPLMGKGKSGAAVKQPRPLSVPKINNRILSTGTSDGDVKNNIEFRGIAAAITYLCALAFCTEGSQHFLNARGAALSDALINVFGVFLAVLVCWSCKRNTSI